MRARPRLLTRSLSAFRLVRLARRTKHNFTSRCRALVSRCICSLIARSLCGTPSPGRAPGDYGVGLALGVAVSPGVAVAPGMAVSLVPSMLTVGEAGFEGVSIIPIMLRIGRLLRNLLSVQKVPLSPAALNCVMSEALSSWTT